MTQKQLKYFFHHAQQEYEKIVTDVHHTFNSVVAEEIIAFVGMKTQEAGDQVWKVIGDRFERLNNLEESFPDKPTKEDQNHYIKMFFKLTDPGEISRELQKALRFHYIEKDYQTFMNKMSLQEYGEIFKRYVYPQSFFDQLKHAIVHHIDGLIAPLKEYSEMLGRHAILMDSVREGAQGKALIKGGASLLGMMIGIPFAGAGVGALMGNDHSKINDSLNGVFQHWNQYIDHFNTFMKSLDEHYRLAMMTIYGGTFLRVQEQLLVYHFIFQDLSLVSGEYLLTVTEQEKQDTERWTNETIQGIQQLLKQKRWSEAIQVSGKFFNVVSSRSITARTELLGGASTIYTAHLYYYCAFQESLLEEYKNGHIDSFYETAKKLYQNLQLLIHEKDIISHFMNPGQLLFRFVKEALRTGRTKDLLIIPDYLERVSDRWGKDGYFLGEHAPTIKELTEEMKSFFIIGEFLETIPDLEIKEDKDDEKPLFTLKQLKLFLQIDSEIGQPDEFTQFLKSQYRQLFLFPWRNQSFHWISQHKKKWLAASIAVGLLLAGYINKDPLFELTKDIENRVNSFIEGDYKKEVVTELPDLSPSYVMVATEHANVRAQPSLESNVIYSATQNDRFMFLQEEQMDHEDRTWLLIQLPDGSEGWISSKITEITAE